MPAWALRREAAALLGYVCVALAFAWPLPLRLADAMLGLPNGDAGVYVWNLWVFRHEIVANHRLPFLTSEILALGPPGPARAAQLHDLRQHPRVSAHPALRRPQDLQRARARERRDERLRDVLLCAGAHRRRRRRVDRRAPLRLLAVHERSCGRALQPHAGRAAANLRLPDVPDFFAAQPGTRVRGGRDGRVGVSLRRLLRRLLPVVDGIHGGATRC